MPEKIQTILTFLDQFAPLVTAENWDNVGLLLGDSSLEINTVMTCLTLTPDVAAEAIEKNVGLVVTHHPILFRAVQRLTNETAEGKMLLDLARHRIAVYSPHTAFDSAAHGINQQWCEQLNLKNSQPLRPFESDASLGSKQKSHSSSEQLTGSGRLGDLTEPISLSQLMQKVKEVTGIKNLQYVGNPEAELCRVGVACGAAAEFMHDAANSHCDVMITGEARFHDCLQARIKNISLILVGHYASEHFACQKLAEILQKTFAKTKTFASKNETDPICFF